jgi:hypothetical protein
MKIDPEYNQYCDILSPGDEVLDDLTKTVCKIKKVSLDKDGNVGYWLDNEYVDGGRFPWEISPTPDQLANIDQYIKG